MECHLKTNVQLSPHLPGWAVLFRTWAKFQIKNDLYSLTSNKELIYGQSWE